MPRNALNYTKCAVIVHGKSEFALVKYIYTNLHLPVKIIAKDKGSGSIQINGLLEYLRKKQFRTLKEFAKNDILQGFGHYPFHIKNWCIH